MDSIEYTQKQKDLLQKLNGFVRKYYNQMLEENPEDVTNSIYPAEQVEEILYLMQEHNEDHQKHIHNLNNQLIKTKNLNEFYQEQLGKLLTRIKKLEEKDL